MRLIRIALIIALTCLFAVALVGCGEKVGTAPDGNEDTIATTAIRVAKDYRDAPYKLLGTEKLKEWVDLGEIMTIIDVRPESDFLKGHLSGAVNVEIVDITEDEATAEQAATEAVEGTGDEVAETPDETTAQIEALLALLPENPESIVVIYDGHTALTGSHRAAIYAADAGYTKVYRYLGGAAAWTAAGHKLTKQ